MRIIKRKRPRRKGDKFELMRNLPDALLPAEFRPRRGNKFADPEDILQGEVNELCIRTNQFQFRLSAHVLERAHDWTVSGWPDDPLITKLAPGLALLGPLELKKPGEALNEHQERLKPILGTVVADDFKTAEAYFHWYRRAVDVLKIFLRDNPLPPAPERTP